MRADVVFAAQALGAADYFNPLGRKLGEHAI
jgi:hypothetical protein